MVYLTSDTHFFHERVIAYCKRPFANVEEMNAEMVRRWNARVGTGDIVYHLGDVAWGGKSQLVDIRAKLNGQIVLVKGNHDQRTNTAYRSAGFTSVVDRLDMFSTYFDETKAPRPLVLRHHPPNANELAIDPTALWLHGHVHERWARRGNAINVGVDVRDFEPKTFAELLATPETP